jgi:hypothetical protein
VLDAAAEPVGILDILVNITLRVDHGGHVAVLISHQIGGMRQAPEVVLPEDQRKPPQRGPSRLMAWRRPPRPPCSTSRNLGMTGPKCLDAPAAAIVTPSSKLVTPDWWTTASVMRSLQHG